VVLEGLEGFRAGALLFIKVSHPSAVSLVISLFVSLAFLGLALEVHRRHGRERFANPYVMPAVIVLLTMAVFSGTFVINDYFLKRDVLRLEEQTQAIYNSSMRFAPESGTFDLESQQTIDIQVLTGGEAINSTQVNVSYDPGIVRIEEILTEGSFCPPEFFVQKEVDNLAGKVSIACGLPSPGLTKEVGTVATLVMQPVASGNAALRFEPGTRVLANDGLGTDVLRVAIDAGYRIEDFRYAPGTARVPRALPFSFSHPNPERWYNRRDVHLNWPVAKGESYFYAFDREPDTIPDKEAPASGRLVLDMAEEGIYYFHLQASKDRLKSPVAHLKVKIDATPPMVPIIRASSLQVRPGEVVRFEFSGIDTLSGIQSNYYVKLGDSIFLPALPQVYMPFLREGRYALTARVFDNAGNFSDSTVEITVRR
jgi:hypothetical protein